MADLVIKNIVKAIDFNRVESIVDASTKLWHAQCEFTRTDSRLVDRSNKDGIYCADGLPSVANGRNFDNCYDVCYDLKTLQKQMLSDLLELYEFCGRAKIKIV